MTKYTLICILSIYIISCSEKSINLIDSIENLTHVGSQCSRVVKDQNGNIFLSWVEILPDTSYAFMMSSLEPINSTFPDRHMIAQGKDWFVNWADMPGIYPFTNGTFLAYWLQMSSSGTYDYDVMYSIGSPETQWSEPKKLHADTIPAEHGFVSVTAMGEDLMLAWLDGRYTKENLPEDQYTHDTHGHSGSMTLRSAIISSDGTITHRQEVDHRVCDCCQTDLAVGANGTIVVYRDRSEFEIRDIYMSTYKNGNWIEPRTIAVDDWKIYGCPVNGPAITASDSLITIAWYSEHNEESITQVKWSHDGGITYQSPMTIGDKKTLGRVDIEIIDLTTIFASWMEGEGSKAMIKGAWIDITNRQIGGIDIAPNNSARKSGFPKIIQNQGHIFMSYTDALDNDTKVKTIKISQNNVKQ
jgi:hypothetical protein